MHLTSPHLPALTLAVIVAGCATPRGTPVPTGHLTAPAPLAQGIPELVAYTPPLPTPATEQNLERYSVVVNNVPVRDVIFALARDGRLNVDLHPAVKGTVTLNAIDQTVPQILDRLGRQVNLRYELHGPNLLVTPDVPHLQSYRIDYVNLSRKSAGTVSVATQIATTGSSATSGAAGSGGPDSGNNSTTVLTQESANLFWETLIGNVHGVLGATSETAATDILANRESGLLLVRATSRQHREIRHLVDQVMTRARQQVLIEATVVEVELSDRFQAGVDWSALDTDAGITINQQLTATALAMPPVTTLTIDRPQDNLLATIRMLEQFGQLKVLSSPKVMALNNQTAMLKVVDNRVYFTVSVTVESATATSSTRETYDTQVHTVPIGFVMAVTPQIGEQGLITVNVRPTISRILGYVRDPNPALAHAGVISEIPEIQVREIESVLKVASGQIAVLGGLMQDTIQNSRRGMPWLSRIPLLGNLFSYRDDQLRKTELVVFLRPSVITTAHVGADLDGLRNHLPGNLTEWMRQ